MELLNFIKVLLRHKLILITIPIITVAITFFLVRNLADSYQSRSRVATGIIDRPDAILILNNNTSESKINQEFSNITERMVQKRTLSQVSYLLLLHDLTDQTAFRKKSEQLAGLTNADKKNVADDLRQKHKHWQQIDITTKEGSKLQDLLKSMRYDEVSLKENLSVYRINNSDFIDLQFGSEDPQLSSFVLGNLCTEFIYDFTANLNENKNKTISFLDSIMRQKQDTLRKKMQALKDYKIRNGVLDVNNQASTLIGQIAEFEAKRQEAQGNISAYQGALKNIDARFDPNDRRYVESSLTELNGEVLSTRNRLNTANDDYIKSNFDPRIKARADSLQASLTEKINQTSDKTAYSPLASKKDLVLEKLNMEMSLELAKNSVSSISSELSRLNGRLYTLVPNQAAIETLQDDIDIYSKEFSDISNKYNQAILDGNFTTKLKLVELAMPGIKQPSKKLLLVILAGGISFIFCVVIMFVLFFFNASISDPKDLANKTNIPVLGTVNLVKGDVLNLHTIWSNTDLNQSGDTKELKSVLRSIRFEIDQQLTDQKIITLTSLNAKVGKTFIALNLAYACKAANKRVVMIDGNFENPGLTNYMGKQHQHFIEDYFLADNSVLPLAGPQMVILGNRGLDTSLSEIASHAVIKSKLQLLKDHFDIIIIEAPSLTIHSKAKEWIGYSEKIIPVFEAGQSFNPSMNQELEYLKVYEEKVIGWILNKVKLSQQVSVTKSSPLKMVQA